MDWSAISAMYIGDEMKATSAEIPVRILDVKSNGTESATIIRIHAIRVRTAAKRVDIFLPNLSTAYMVSGRPISPPII